MAGLCLALNVFRRGSHRAFEPEAIAISFSILQETHMKLLTRSLIALFAASMLLSACSKTDESADTAADTAVTPDAAPAAEPSTDAAPDAAAPAPAEEPASEEPGGWVPPPAEGS